eukprot:TRINITY_DN18577_c0_g2_i1.p1 TRINITY_DN18577_c0_g2~~TRINITY_DN18577_c0_g2_i1.p1  ORF type:complete len:458 (+),score=69.35 TRINITY_DN18577_c0_g2_i1:89-1462(+)
MAAVAAAQSRDVMEPYPRSSSSRSVPPPESPDHMVARATEMTVAWLDRCEKLIAAKQRHYVSRMHELYLEMSLPPKEQCPVSQARARRLAGKQLEDIRELLVMVRDTMEQLPPQLRFMAPAAATSASEDALASAVTFVDALPACTSSAGGDCPVCLSELCGGEDEVVALPCGNGTHCFHRQCIRDWAGVSARCPLCRDAFGLDADAAGKTASPSARLSVLCSASPPSRPSSRGGSETASSEAPRRAGTPLQRRSSIPRAPLSSRKAAAPCPAPSCDDQMDALDAALSSAEAERRLLQAGRSGRELRSGSLPPVSRRRPAARDTTGRAPVTARAPQPVAKTLAADCQPRLVAPATDRRVSRPRSASREAAKPPPHRPAAVRSSSEGRRPESGGLRRVTSLGVVGKEVVAPPVSAGTVRSSVGATNGGVVKPLQSRLLLNRCQKPPRPTRGASVRASVR